MYKFADANGGIVRLSFSRDSFGTQPKHVLIICRMGKNWVLTKHKERGIEFPGGKVEKGETLEDAAVREVWEETGGIINSLQFIGEYEVDYKGKKFVKAIFWGVIDKLADKEHYFETSGPILIDGDLLELRWDKQYSFIMKDQVIEKSIEWVLAAKS